MSVAFLQGYEGVKASHEADLTTVESCINKCDIHFDKSAEPF